MTVEHANLRVNELYALWCQSRILFPASERTSRTWDMAKKQRLIDAMLQGLSIPTLLCASHSDHGGRGACLEVIDGVQRVHAIVGFIQNAFASTRGFFDKEACALGESKRLPHKGLPRLPIERSKAFLDYRLPLTLCQVEEEESQGFAAVELTFEGGSRGVLPESGVFLG